MLANLSRLLHISITYEKNVHRGEFAAELDNIHGMYEDILEGFVNITGVAVPTDGSQLASNASEEGNGTSSLNDTKPTLSINAVPGAVSCSVANKLYARHGYIACYESINSCINFTNPQTYILHACSSKQVNWKLHAHSIYYYSFSLDLL